MRPDPLNTEQRKIHRRLSRLRLMTYGLMSAERGLSSYAPFVLGTLFFSALWLLGWPQYLGTGGRIFSLFLSLGTVSVLLESGIRNFHWPTHNEINRRLERDSGLAHRPLEQLDDKLANPKDRDTRTLWAESRAVAWGYLKRLRPPRLRPVLSRRDPWALRIFICLFFIIAVIVAGPSAPDRLYDAAKSLRIDPSAGKPPVILWITPPDYTALPRVTVEGHGQVPETVDIPEGSTIKARVSGGFGTPHLVFGDEATPFQQTDGRHWHLETAINTPGDPQETPGALKIKQVFFPRLSLPVKIIEDQPPSLSLKNPPESTARGHINIPLTVEDDYAVTDLTLTMSLSPETGGPPMGAPVTRTRAVMTAGGAPQDIKPGYDLTWHPWAGLPVHLTLSVSDHAGHTTRLPPIEFTLPEREFYHPVAKKLISLRQELIWTESASRQGIIEALYDIMVRPSDYQNDPVVFLSLRTMASRLSYDNSPEAARSVVEQLWDTALSIEEGDVALAARTLREKRAALEKLLNDENATEDEIARAMTELRAAMADYFQELHREMQKRMAQGENIPQISPETMDNVLRPEDLSAFLEQLQSEALSGDRDNARKMLSELQKLMDSMDPSTAMEMPPEMKFMQEGIGALKELIEKQKSLRDRTKEQAESLRRQQPQQYPEPAPLDEQTQTKWQKEGMPPPPHLRQNRQQQQTQTPPDGQKPPEPGKQNQPEQNQPEQNKTQQSKAQQNRAEQDDLRYDLGDLMRKADEHLGEIPRNMQDAEQQMRQSAKNLGDNRPDRALPHQGKAIDHLEQSQNQMQQQMQQMIKQMQMMAFGAPLDPLGRPYNKKDGSAPMPQSNIKIPEEADRKRVREILEELREKSGDFNRPEYELEYFRRLMRQF